MKRFNPAIYADRSAPLPENRSSAEIKPEKSPPMAAGSLPVGTRITHDGNPGIIYKIDGDQSPDTVESIGRGVVMMGGSAIFHIVFTGEHPHLGQVPEALLYTSERWQIMEGMAAQQEINSALAAAQQRRDEMVIAESARASRRAKEKAELPARHPYLIQAAISGKSSHAAGAANLKVELTRAFPGVKFSVKSESYTGGDNIRVSWEAGPTTNEVEAITNKYQQGHFDGMTDSYEYNSNNVWPEVFGGARFVFSKRSFPPALYETVSRALCGLQRVAYPGESTRLFDGDDRRTVSDYTHTLLHRTSFPRGSVFKGVEFSSEPTAAKPRFGDDWCQIVFEQTAVNSTSAAATLTESIHTKHRYPIWVVQLSDRVPREMFEQLLDTAKALGGYYSMYRGNGAIPGFTFKVREAAGQFMKQLSVEADAPPAAPTPVAGEATVPPVTPPPPNLGLADKVNLPVKFVETVNEVPVWRRRFSAR